MKDSVTQSFRRHSLHSNQAHHIFNSSREIPNISLLIPHCFEDYSSTTRVGRPILRLMFFASRAACSLSAKWPTRTL